MTDEERQKLAELHAIGDCDISVDSTTHDLCKWAADEIERLAEERDQLAEQFAIRSESGMAKDMQEIMRINNEQADEIKRLVALVKSDTDVKSMLETSADLIEQLAHELVATNKRLEQLEACVEALERM